MDDENVEATNQLLKACIQEQCNEIEMLQSIFCNAGEMCILDHSILIDMFDFVEGKRPNLNSKLDFTITVAAAKTNQMAELQFELPFTYPTLEEPGVTVRLKGHSPHRAQSENHVKRELCEYIAGDDIDKSTVYIYPIIVWLQENIDRLIESPTEFESKASPSSDASSAEPTEEMQRLWIYSHHLKSAVKRQDILKLAKDLELSGFSKPGKPGIICIEGTKDNTNEFWKCIRQWAWQKIQLRLSETKIRPLTKCAQFRRFDDFREVLYGDVGSVLPIDMGEFMKFLETHNCGYVKKDLLQLD